MRIVERERETLYSTLSVKGINKKKKKKKKKEAKNKLKKKKKKKSIASFPRNTNKYHYITVYSTV